MWDRVRAHGARFFPLTDLTGYGRAELRQDLVAAAAVSTLSVPQGLAYAMIAGVPPVVGLYAAAIPAIIGSLFRSSRTVVTGPTNAVSLLVGSIVAAHAGLSPMQLAAVLSLMVGLMQFGAGVLRLGSLVDFISTPVVLGYITGAGILIGVGQLKNVTGTPAESGTLVRQVSSWVEGLQGVSWLAVVVAMSTFGCVWGLRRLDRRIPGAVIAMGLGILASWLLDFGTIGVKTVGDLAPVPTGLPPLTVPPFAEMGTFLGAAMACALLSLVESSSSARAIAARQGQRLDMSVEFAGQGLANIFGAFAGAFPTSGSLTRSALNETVGAATRLSGAFSGLVMLLVLTVLGPVVDLTPIASLAGLLLVVAVGLVDVPHIRTTVRATGADAVAFVVTLLGTWLFPLDVAVELGVGISIVLFLRRVRVVGMRELIPTKSGRLTEVDLELPSEPSHDGSTGRCHAIRVLHLEGPLFFGSAGELLRVAEQVAAEPGLRVLVLRIKRVQHMDISAVRVIEDLIGHLKRSGQHLVLAGAGPRTYRVIRQTGLLEKLGADNLFPTEPGWFAATARALRRAGELAGEHGDGPGCPWKSVTGP